MSDQQTFETRPRRALYYPYISLRNVDWLKATLLAFGQVQRMVPRDYQPSMDELEIRLYEGKIGPFGPLVQAAEIGDPLVLQAQDELCQKLERNLRIYKGRFSRWSTVREFGYVQAESFQIHAGKLSGSLSEFLMRNNLGWHPEMHRTREPESWLAIHPKLGSAILSTLAVPIAERSSLDIVTDDPKIHSFLVRKGGESPFDAILHKQPLAAEDATGRLLHVVITSNFFDYRKLGPDDVVNLLNDHAALVDVRHEMRSVLQDIPATRNMRELHQMLEHAARVVTANWIRSSRQLPRRIVGPATKIVGSLTGLALAIAGHRPIKILSEASGLTISVVEHARKVSSITNGPYRYLSTIEAASGQASGGLFLPAWSRLSTESDYGEFHAPAPARRLSD